MKKRLIMVPLLAGLTVGLPRAAQADTYRQLKACLRNCINTTRWGTWKRFACVLDCYAAWADQKLSININVSPSSTGYGEIEGLPYLVLDAGAPATVAFDILSGDPLERIDLILVNDDNNPDDPDFGVLVGSDNDGGDGWAVTFDPSAYGPTPWSGVLVGEAHFTGHDLETDGDIALIAALACTPAGPSVTLSNGVVGDGELEVNPDAYGAVTVWGWRDNYDWYDPSGADARNNCAFAASCFVYNPGTLDRVALGEPLRDLDLTYNQRGGGEGTLSYEVVWPLCAWDSDGDGFDDSATSTFHVFGGNGNYNLIFDLLQTVSKPGAGDASTWLEVYTITNIAAEPASLLLERHDDLDLMYDNDFMDAAGSASSGGVRNVYMREPDDVPNHDNLVVALSGTPGYDYCAGRSGFDPDDGGPDPPMGYGTDFQIWENYGLPDSWKNYTAGIGYNQDGILGDRQPPGGSDPYDGFMVLQWPLTLAGDEATDIEIVTTYGSMVPVGPCEGDLDGDGDTDQSDLGILLGDWGCSGGGCAGDLDGDGDTDQSDLGILLGDWGCGG